MLNLDFDQQDDVPMHDAPLERQVSVAAAEGRLLVNAFEGSSSSVNAFECNNIGPFCPYNTT